jgi:hypothetical protein
MQTAHWVDLRHLMRAPWHRLQLAGSRGAVSVHPLNTTGLVTH